MKDDEKTKEQLVHELSELRSQNAALEKSITGIILFEVAAEEARRYAESIVETVREPLLVLDADLKIISANRNFYRTFKVTPAETIGTFIYDLGNKQWDIPKLRELLEEVLPEKEAFDDFEVEHNFQDIGHKIMLLNARQIYRKDIGSKMILLAIEDITEHKRLENLLKESEKRYKRVFETASDGIVFFEQHEGKITHANPATEKMLGYTQKEIIGSKLQDIGITLDMGDFQTTLRNLDKSGILNYRNVKAETKSGQHIDTEISLVDRAELVQCNIRDITERKRAKEALRLSEEKYRWMLDNMADVITVMDMNLRFTYVSPSIMRMRGYTAEEAAVQTFEQVMTPESMQISAKVFEEETKLEASGTADPDRIRIVEVEQYRKDGSIVLMENHLSFMRDEAKKPVGIISVSHDITDRKRAEEEIKNIIWFQQVLMDAVPSPIFYKDADCVYIGGNKAFERYLGLSPEQFIGKTVMDISPADLAEKYDKADRDLLNHPGVQNYETSVVYADGTRHDVIFNKATFTDAKGKVGGLIGVILDITDRKQAEEDMKETLESLRKAFGATVQVLVSAVETRDPYTSGHQTRSADLACAIATEMGLSPERIVGIHMAGSIHDIGKMSVPAEILSKPTKLSELEFSLIKEHAGKGFELLKDVESPWPLAEMVYQHHERMDGSGYPRNLKGDDIIIESRILAVADVVEAMASHRPYRPALGIDAALEEIEKNSGTIYDKTVTAACLRLFKEKGFKLEEARI